MTRTPLDANTLPWRGFGSLLSTANSDQLLSKLKNHDEGLDAVEAALLEGSGGFTYNVLNYGLVSDGTTDNRTAMSALLTTVKNAGGGTVYFPGVGTGYHFSLVAAGASMDLIDWGDSKLRLMGDGPKSIVTYGGDAGGGPAHLLRVRQNARHIEISHLCFGQKNLTNADEQSHLLFFVTGLSGGADGGNIEQVNIHHCRFKAVKGDCVRLLGSLDWDFIKATVAGTVAAGAVPGPFTNPARPQAIAIRYPAAWDGGSFTVSGTDINDGAISEVIPAAVNDTAIGYLEFKTISGITKSATGTTSNTANIGVSYEVKDATVDSCYFNGHDFEGSDPGYGYRACVTPQRGTRRMKITNCWMTGSDDQLIDFEATGNGGLFNFTIEHNTIISTSITSTNAPSPAVTLYGNGNSLAIGSNLCEQSSFSHNYLYGRISGGILRDCRINYNYIVADTTPTTAESCIGLTDTLTDVDICGNTIIIQGTAFAGHPIGLESGSGYAGRGVRVNGNTIKWYSGAGITCKDVTDLEIAGNRLIYLNSTTNTDDAIVTSSAIIDPHSRLRIHGNYIYGNQGSGTVRWGINVGAANPRGIMIYGNDGEGVQTRGISLPAGTYTEPPIVFGNGFLGATTPLLVGAGVVISDWSPRGPATKTSGNLDASASTNYLSVTGTQAYTLPNGIVWGQRMIVECTVAASTPVGTLTVTTPYSGDPSTYVFNTVGQLLEFIWEDAAGWRCIRKVRVGSQTAVLGTNTISGLVAIVNLSITGTVNGALPNGAVHGEAVQVRCTTAASTPNGTVTGLFRAADNTATTNALFDATADYFIATWDGSKWLVSASNSVVFS